MRVAPWEALAGIGAGRARLDASTQTLTTAPRSPGRGEAARWFADESARLRVYEAYGLEARTFAKGE